MLTPVNNELQASVSAVELAQKTVEAGQLAFIQAKAQVDTIQNSQVPKIVLDSTAEIEGFPAVVRNLRIEQNFHEMVFTVRVIKQHSPSDPVRYNVPFKHARLCVRRA
jgi:hypothetical protein